MIVWPIFLAIIVIFWAHLSIAAKAEKKNIFQLRLHGSPRAYRNPKYGNRSPHHGFDNLHGLTTEPAAYFGSNLPFKQKPHRVDAQH
jgi:hypothetical protein